MPWLWCCFNPGMQSFPLQQKGVLQNSQARAPWNLPVARRPLPLAGWWWGGPWPRRLAESQGCLKAVQSPQEKQPKLWLSLESCTSQPTGTVQRMLTQKQVSLNAVELTPGKYSFNLVTPISGFVREAENATGSTFSTLFLVAQHTP